MLVRRPIARTFFSKRRDRQREHKEFVITAADVARFEVRLSKNEEAIIATKLDTVWRWRIFLRKLKISNDWPANQKYDCASGTVGQCRGVQQFIEEI